ncbi:FadR/GntR family transcriptional regulator [Peribacillus castrilensis]|uniref:FadR/GntR family transcriptional regulator n=1 Tax=Bacillaceae TaxID=186817 RepID=UPI000660D6BF|nr:MULTISPECIES: FadR/GntR family transcriptional regulator [Bacillaceae]MBD8586366.1 FadR family transcriptional regulator [Peribacillus simplex]MEA3573690.1 FadR/GntR family transcriptional regulator [Peribacillus frigoritolerans]NCT37187.1 FadR family transcriptional regulator [Peribacillus frigoritolerans]PRA95544.1 FadR family transcriptional regulator [Peribacillus simplex]
MVYKKIKPKKIYEEVSDELYEMIRSGSLKPGEQLDSIQQLAENFQVGRPAIREALSALSSMGLIEIKQGEGTFVKTFDPAIMNHPLSAALLMDQDNIKHLLEVRKILESGTAEVAAKKRTEENLIELKDMLFNMDKVSDDEELSDKADISFHVAVANASQNELLITLMNHVSELMTEKMRDIRRVALYSEEMTLKQLYQQHVRIYDAIVAQDEDGARSAMLFHLQSVEESLDRVIQKNQHKNH